MMWARMIVLTESATPELREQHERRDAGDDLRRHERDQQQERGHAGHARARPRHPERERRCRAPSRRRW